MKMSARRREGKESAKSQSHHDKPKRSLTAYNIFFKEQRKQILLHGGGSSGGFSALARTIATRWKSVEPEKLEALRREAANDRMRYQREMVAWEIKRKSSSPAPSPGGPSRRFGHMSTIGTSGSTTEIHKPTTETGSQGSFTTGTCHLAATPSDPRGLPVQRPYQIPFCEGHIVSSMRNSPMGIGTTAPIWGQQGKIVSVGSSMRESPARAEVIDHGHVTFSRIALKRIFESTPLDFCVPRDRFHFDLDDETNDLFDRMLSHRLY